MCWIPHKQINLLSLYDKKQINAYVLLGKHIKQISVMLGRSKTFIKKNLP